MRSTFTLFNERQLNKVHINPHPRACQAYLLVPEPAHLLRAPGVDHVTDVVTRIRAVSLAYVLMAHEYIWDANASEEGLNFVRQHLPVIYRLFPNFVNPIEREEGGRDQPRKAPNMIGIALELEKTLAYVVKNHLIEAVDFKRALTECFREALTRGNSLGLTLWSQYFCGKINVHEELKEFLGDSMKKKPYKWNKTLRQCLFDLVYFDFQLDTSNAHEICRDGILYKLREREATPSAEQGDDLDYISVKERATHEKSGPLLRRFMNVADSGPITSSPADMSPSLDTNSFSRDNPNLAEALREQVNHQFGNMFSQGGSGSKAILDSLQAGMQGALAVASTNAEGTKEAWIAEAETTWTDRMEPKLTKTITDVVQEVVAKPMKALLAYKISAETSSSMARNYMLDLDDPKLTENMFDQLKETVRKQELQIDSLQKDRDTMVKAVGRCEMDKEVLIEKVEQFEFDLFFESQSVVYLEKMIENTAAQHKSAVDHACSMNQNYMTEINQLKEQRSAKAAETKATLEDKDEQISNLTAENDSAMQVINRNEEARKALDWVLQVLTIPEEATLNLDQNITEEPGKVRAGLRGALIHFYSTIHTDKFSKDEATGVYTPRKPKDNGVKLKTEQLAILQRFGTALNIARNHLQESFAPPEGANALSSPSP